MEDNTRTGLPLLRPLFLEFPDAAPDRHPIDIDLNASGEFMVGPDLLVAAPPFPDKDNDYDAKLPSPGWYDFWTGERVQANYVPVNTTGQQADAAMSTVHIHSELASLPVFVRPGAMIPVAPLVQSTVERPQGPLRLRVFPGPECSGHLYQDDGTSFAYKQGDFLRMSFTCEISDASGDLTIHISRHEARHPAWWQQIAVEVNGLSRQPAAATVDGRAVPVSAGSHSVTILVTDHGDGMTIVVPAVAPA